MKILFITAHKYLPQMVGGLQSSCHQLCHSLIARGHEVSVLAGLMGTGLFGVSGRIKLKFTSRPATRTKVLGYPAWYAWFPWQAISYVASVEDPDIIVVMTMGIVRMALAAKSTGIPLLLQLQDVEFSQHDGPFDLIASFPCIANSQFTATKYQQSFGVKPAVIHSFIDPSFYKTPTTRENVTFINPVAQKGRELAIAIAERCPHIPFTFVEGWPLPDRQELQNRLAKLSNVTFLKPQNDMRKVYSKCRILLAPSIWEEAYGRVVTEAQISGIPVIASNRGGLPEAVGDGGIVLSPEQPVDDWVKALCGLWSNQEKYDELSQAALRYANRPMMQKDYQVQQWEKAIYGIAHHLQEKTEWEDTKAVEKNQGFARKS